jgi:hypothetical protein
MSLTDYFRPVDENFFVIVAYHMDVKGDLFVHNIKDESITKAVADGKLTKQGDADINSSPEQVIEWLKTLTETDFKIYAQYQRIP